MLLRRRHFDADLEEEMRLHVELRGQQQIEAGASAEEARYAALRRFGNVSSLRERSHIAWGWSWFENLVQDTGYGIRWMLRSPGVTLVALLSLALGIGANTAIFTLLNAILMRPLPVEHPSQLVLLGDGLDGGISDGFPNTGLYSYPFFRQIRARNDVFSDMAAAFSFIDNVHGTVQGRGEAEPMKIQLVSGSYFPLLGIQAAAGRTLQEDDDRIEGQSPVAMVSYAWWKTGLAADPAVIGKRLTIGSTAFTIVGVTPPPFFGTRVGELPDLWIPLSMEKHIPPGLDGYNDGMSESLNLIGRLKPGVSREQAESNVNVLFQQILRSIPNAPLNAGTIAKLNKAHVELTPIPGGIASRIRWFFQTPLEVLMAVVGLVLLIACANIANLMLARASARSRELAVRQALGAGRSRLIRQLLTESLVLALLGGGLGLGFAVLASRLLVRMASSADNAFQVNISLSVPVLLFTLALTLATAILFGTIPAWHATRVDVSVALAAGRTQSGTASKGPLAKILVILQVALSLVLVAGAGIFLRSLINLVSVDTGFQRDNVIRMRVDASSAGYKEDARLAGVYRQIEDRVKAIPGVRAASFSIFTFNEGTWNNDIWVQGYAAGHREIDVLHNDVGNDYFRAMGIPLIAGRTFGPQDTATSPRVAVIGETMARKLFPRGSPIGRHYGYQKAENAGSFEVIGVVKDVKYYSLDEPQACGDYLPYSQNVRYLNEFEVRYTGDSAAVITAIRRTVGGIDANLHLSDVGTLNQKIDDSLTNRRLVAQLSIFFGLLAVFLAAIGIYGLMSYLVSRRTSEIGVRMALGAERPQVLWLVMREILLLAAIGLAIGIPLALAGGRLVSNSLYGLKGTDIVSLGAAVAVLLAMAALAGYLPARRASRIDPMIALRHE